MIASASVARFDGLFRSSERSIHIAGIRTGLPVANLREIDNDKHAFAETCAAMEKGVPVIAQATLANGRWFGRSDVLLRVERPSGLGSWSYEVYDCKLAR